MRHIHLKKNKFFCPVINVDQLWSLLGESVRTNYAKVPNVAPVLNCVEKVKFCLNSNIQYTVVQNVVLRAVHKRRLQSVRRGDLSRGKEDLQMRTSSLFWCKNLQSF